MKPIIFSGPMVRAILDGRKTQTRRVVKPQPPATHVMCGVNDVFWLEGKDEPGECPETSCPYGQPGDRLWVKETHKPHFDAKKLWTCVKYKADGAMVKPTLWTENEGFQWEAREKQRKWTPSILMPRFASRITLEIVKVRVERLQDINYSDAVREGVFADKPEFINAPLSAPDAFATLWTSIHGTASWAANLWVWVIEFRRIKP